MPYRDIAHTLIISVHFLVCKCASQHCNTRVPNYKVTITAFHKPTEVVNSMTVNTQTSLHVSSSQLAFVICLLYVSTAFQ